MAHALLLGITAITGQTDPLSGRDIAPHMSLALLARVAGSLARRALVRSPTPAVSVSNFRSNLPRSTGSAA